MKIIETFTTGKTGDEDKNEDAIVITPDFIAVLDGVTSKKCPLIDGMTGGRFAAMAVARAIERMPPETGSVAAVRYLSRELQDSISEKTSLPSQVDTPAVVAALYSRARKEIWRVGDMALMVDGMLYDAGKEIDRITSAARALALEIALRKGRTLDDIALHDIGRDQIMPLLEGQHVFANSPGPYGYAVIDGRGVPEEMIEVFDVKGVRAVVIASDGYPRLFPTLTESEAFLTGVLRDDPLLFRMHKSTKGIQPGNISFDDRTYVSFMTEG